jgi:hypothetical protein
VNDITASLVNKRRSRMNIFVAFGLLLLATSRGALAQWQPPEFSMAEACASPPAFVEAKLNSDQGAFSGVDIHMRVIFDQVERLNDSVDKEEKVSYQNLNRRVDDVIRFMGEILPRVERSMDLPVLVHHLKNNSLQASDEASAKEIFGIALLDYVRAEHSPAIAGLADFIAVFAQFDHQLGALINNTDSIEIADLHKTGIELERLYKEAWSPVIRRGLFTMEAASSLRSRMARECDLSSPVKGVLANRPISALCGVDPDLLRYYQRERRAVLLDFDLRAEILRKGLDELWLVEAFTAVEQEKAMRLQKRAVDVRQALGDFFPTLASNDDTVLLKNLENSQQSPMAASSVYAILDYFLVRGIFQSSPRISDNLLKYVERLAQLTVQLEALAADVHAVEQKAFNRIASDFRNIATELQRVLRLLLNEPQGVQTMEALRTDWCAIPV